MRKHELSLIPRRWAWVRFWRNQQVAMEIEIIVPDSSEEHESSDPEPSQAILGHDKVKIAKAALKKKK